MSDKKHLSADELKNVVRGNPLMNMGPRMAEQGRRIVDGVRRFDDAARPYTRKIQDTISGLERAVLGRLMGRGR
jgi:hypothetical protein